MTQNLTLSSPVSTRRRVSTFREFPTSNSRDARKQMSFWFWIFSWQTFFEGNENHTNHCLLFFLTWCQNYHHFVLVQEPVMCILRVFINSYEHAALITLSSSSQKAEPRRWVTTEKTGDKAGQRAERFVTEESLSQGGAAGPGAESGWRGQEGPPGQDRRGQDTCRVSCVCCGRVAACLVNSHPGLKTGSNSRCGFLLHLPRSWPRHCQVSSTERLSVNTCFPGLRRVLN